MKLVIDIKDQLINFNSEINELNNQMVLFAENKVDDHHVLNMLLSLNAKYPCNNLIITKLLEFLQLVNNETIYKNYSLYDIKEIYELSIKLFRFDADLNIEYYHYLNSVLDLTDDSDSFMEEFKERISLLLTATKNDL